LPKAHLVLITGMPGSGKTTFAHLFEDHGYSVLTMGDVVRDIAKGMKLEPTIGNLGLIAEEIRRREGAAAVALRCVGKLKKERLEQAVVDGIRSLDEVEAFREAFRAILIAVHASPRTRFDRMTKRGRSDDTVEQEQFKERDLRELGFGLGSAIAMADFMVVNEGSLTDLRQAFEGMMRRLEETL
jgi:dephospho-CoA kinase